MTGEIPSTEQRLVAQAHLIGNRDDCGNASRTWTQHYITAQTAFVGGATAMTSFWLSQHLPLDFTFAAMFTMLALVAVTIARFLKDNTVRQLRFQAWYIDRHTAIGEGDNNLRVFPNSGKFGDIDDISKRGPGFIERTTRKMDLTLRAAWILSLATIWLVVVIQVAFPWIQDATAATRSSTPGSAEWCKAAMEGKIQPSQAETEKHGMECVGHMMNGALGEIKPPGQ